MPGFEIGVTVTIPYATLRDLARSQLSGRDLEVRDGVTIRVDDLDLAPRDGRLEVALDFAVTRMKKLPVKPDGRLVVLGDPRVDPEERRLTIGDLELDVETDHLLLRTADRLLHRPLLARLEEALDIPLDEPLRRAERYAGEKLHDVRLGRGGRLTCTVTELRPRLIAITDAGLEATVDVVGHGEVRLEMGAVG